MTEMTSLIKRRDLLSSNGDATETYFCQLSRNDITVKEFAEAIENSVNGHGQAFREYWAVVSMSLKGQPALPAVAYYVVYGNLPGTRFRDIELDGEPSTIEDLLKKYGDYIVSFCNWNGGWSMGGYYLKIQEKAETVPLTFKKG